MNIVSNLFGAQAEYWSKVAANTAQAESQQKQGQEHPAGMNRHERRKAAALARRKKYDRRFT